MRYLAAVCLLCLLAALPAFGDDRVRFARSLPAKAYDPALPSIPVDQWLSSQLPKGIVAQWGDYVTDCGEQTGDPAVDRQRDMPLCAEIELKQGNSLVGYLLLSIGTEKKGVSGGLAGLFSGYVQQGKSSVDLKRLGDVGMLGKQYPGRSEPAGPP